MRRSVVAAAALALAGGLFGVGYSAGQSSGKSAAKSDYAEALRLKQSRAIDAGSAADDLVTVPLNQITVPPTTAAPTTTTALGPLTTFGQGTWEVNVDIQAGKYKSEGGENCYWKKADRNGDIIKNYYGAGPAVVIIEPSVFTFETSRCADWVKSG